MTKQRGNDTCLIITIVCSHTHTNEQAVLSTRPSNCLTIVTRCILLLLCSGSNWMGDAGVGPFTTIT